MKTLLLDKAGWDLTIDAGGDIATVDDPYSLAQDAASQIKLFQGELYFDATQGVPYLQQILGFSPPLSLVKQYLVSAALLVPEVASATCYFSGWSDRVLSGQVQIKTSTGQTAAANF